jgi:formate hydrogenlyase subunit 6/NADH:ubiquinone oxidoreductase subunit I
MRGVRAVRRGVPRRRNLSRSGGKRRDRHGRSRYAITYQIHKTRCIFCGFCEEACPVSAIFMGKDYELAVYNKSQFVWDKADLLVPAQAGAVTPDAR